jgi:hypothetical protein
VIAERLLRARSLFAWLAIAAVSTVGLTAWQRQTTPPVPTFRSASTVVTVNVSVKHGNRPVTGLTDADFTVTDNGVLQHVERVSFEPVPIDATVVIDVSGSTSSIVDDIREDTNKILGLLRPIDRARVLVIDTGVYELLPLQPGGNRLTLPPQPIFGGLSSVRDAILAGLINHPDPERRRIVVALTDADDTKSITEAGAIYEVARRSDTVLHVIIVRPPVNAPLVSTLSLNDTPLAFLRPMQTPAERQLLFEAAAVTGGAVHGAAANDVIVHKVNAVDTFRKVLDEFRQSYVLQYQPENVPATGWHDIAVSVKGVDAKGIRARKGYFAGQ